MHVSRFVCGSLLVGLLAGCQRESFDQMGAGSDVKYLESGWHLGSCLVSHVHEPMIRICIEGNGNRSIGEAKINESAEQWLDPLRARYSNIASGVEYSCENPHGTVYLYNGYYGNPMGGPGMVTIGDGNEIGTFLHEFGHAFACLADTYYGGLAGQCQAGQPKSAMCHGLLISEITDDDIAGVIHQYQRTGRSTTPSNPDEDDDQDGIVNSKDRCPNTEAGADVWGDEENGRWRGCSEGQTPVLF